MAEDPCIHENVWVDLLDGRLAAEARAAIEAHIDRCSDCRRILAELVPGLPSRDGGELEASAPADDDTSVAALGPARISRYVVVEEIGRGGMGRVLRGYDPELRREVALKLLHASGEEARARALGEARALARLTHPHVLPIYDVGEDHGLAFIAMELVDGSTLRGWCERESPGWREVVRRFRDAGTGLAAAHAAGLVHGDFKPDNVLLGADGRVLVADFGLARASDADVVATGVTGTPAYMAPEQHDGHPADAKSDQFAFCVSLYEALAGQRPFRGATLSQLALAKLESAPPLDASSERPVPPWLWQAIRRGLATLPAARWPSMDALVAALDHARPRSLLRTIAVGVLVSAAVLSAVAIARPGAEPCGGARQQLEAVWNRERRAAIESALRATQVVHAPATATAVDTRLSSYAEAWSSAHTDACAATHRGAQSLELMDARMRCLLGRRRALAAVVDMLADADAEVAHRAVAAVEALPPVDRCADAGYVLAQVPPPEDATTASGVDEQRGRLAHATALRSAGRFADALAVAELVAIEADALDYPPLFAEAGLLRGQLHALTGAYERGAEVLHDTYFEARRAGTDETAADTASMLAFVLGAKLGRPDEAQVWIGHAQAEVERFGSDTSRASWTSNLASIRYAEGDYEESMRLSAAAVELLERGLGAGHLQVAYALVGLGNAMYERRKLEDAADAFTRALAILEATLGPQHPDVAGMFSNLGGVAYQRGDYDAAVDLHERALVILEAALGPEHPEVASTLTNLGNAQDAAGASADALRSHERALAIAMRVHGPDHPEVAIVLSNLGNVELAAGQIVAAEDRYRLSLRILEQTRDHPDLAMVLVNLARARQLLGAHDDADALYRRALVARETTLGLDHPDLAYPLLGLGEIALEQQRFDDAKAVLERALRLRGAAEEPTLVADIELALARANAGAVRPR